MTASAGLRPPVTSPVAAPMRPGVREPVPDLAAGFPPRVGVGGLLALLLGVVVAGVAAGGDAERLEVRAEEVRARAGDGRLEVGGEDEVLERDPGDLVRLRRDRVTQLEPVEDLLPPAVRRSTH